MTWWNSVKRFEFTLLFSIIGLSILSTIAIYTATLNRSGMEDWYQKQIVWLVISFVFMGLFTIIDYRILKGVVPWIGYGVCLVLLVVVFYCPAKNGAHCWIPITSGVQFQPSEFAKIFVILTISEFMNRAKQKNEPFSLKHMLVIAVINLIPFVMILKQPHLGQALTLLAITGSMIILFVNRKQLLILFTIGAIMVAVFLLAKTVFIEQSIELVDKLPFMGHQKERIVTFLNPEIEKMGASFQVTQAQIAIGSGELTGKGIGNGKVTQGQWVPEQWTDFIFSAIGEELGFLGGSFLLFLFFLLLYRMIEVARNTEDYFSTCFIMGVVGMFSFQIIENVGMNLAMMPVTGITLPFVSYGGTSLLTNFILIGIILSMGLRNKKLNFS